MTTAAAGDESSTKTLWSLDRGERVRVVGFDDRMAERYRMRLMELGFHCGEIVTCLQAPAFGAPKVYRVANTIFSLDEEVGDYIRVNSV